MFHTIHLLSTRNLSNENDIRFQPRRAVPVQWIAGTAGTAGGVDGCLFYYNEKGLMCLPT